MRNTASAPGGWDRQIVSPPNVDHPFVGMFQFVVSQ